MNENGAIGVLFCVRKCEKCKKREKHGAHGHEDLVIELYSVKKLFFCTKKYCIFGGYMVY